MEVLLVFLGIIAVLGFWVWMDSDRREKEMDQWKVKYAEEKNRVYLETLACCEKHGVGMCPLSNSDAAGFYGLDHNIVDIKCKNSYYTNMWYWNDGKNLIFYNRDKNSDLDMFIVPFDDIEYFTQYGDVSYVNQVENVGKNVSLSGTIVGGAIGGTAGAIIGSRKDANQLVNKTISFDDRKVFIYYRDRESGDLIVVEVKSYGFYSKMIHILPEKEYNQIILNNSIKATSEQDIQIRFDKLEQLYNNGIITEDEYQTKRNALLESI